MRHAYQIVLEQTTESVENVRRTLENVFPVLFVKEEIYKTGRNILAYVGVEDDHSMTDDQRSVIESLGDRYDTHSFCPFWTPEEIEKARIRRQEEEETRRKERENAVYFLCYFRQHEHPWANPEMCVSFVHEETFEDYDIAQKRAKELEEDRYNKGDFNLQVEARLAVSREDAEEGAFIE